MEPYGALTANFDVAQLALYAFFLFFAGLVYYLLRENKREGYPLLSDHSDRIRVEGLPPTPPKKTFRTVHGVISLPREDNEPPLNAVPLGNFQGAPLVPVGDPMLAAVGPGAYANRAEEPDLTFDDGIPKIVPLRVANDWALAAEDTDPRGFAVLGADGKQAGTLADVWVDRSEYLVRFMEVRTNAGRVVLVPAMLTVTDGAAKVVRVQSVLAHQFENAPVLANGDTITLREEDKVAAYFGGGTLYATRARSEPLV